MKYLAAFFVNHLSLFVALHLLEDKKIDFKNKRVYISFAITFLLLIVNYEISLSSIRVIINILIYILLAKSLFQKNLKDCIILGMVAIIFEICAEFLYVVFTYPIFHYTTVLEKNIEMAFVNNVWTGIILIFLCFTSGCKKIYAMVLQITNRIDVRKVAFASLLIIVTFNFFSLILYFISKDIIDKYYLICIGSFICLLCSIFMCVYFQTQSKYLAVYEKYNISLESIREFEILLERYRINTHENKNQFRIIRNMSKNRKVTSYVDALLNDKINDDEQLLTDAKRIPDGGLRGIIYTKMLLMKEKKIPFELVIDKKITTDSTERIDDYTLTAVCKILGVFLDNAIEKVSSLDEGCIIIELYEEDEYLVVSITNNYEGYVDLEAINNPGISTKGNNHGYGLSLVKELVRKNRRLIHENEIIEDNFMQKLKIKV